MNNFGTIDSWDREKNREDRDVLAQEIRARRKAYKDQEDTNQKNTKKIQEIEGEKAQREYHEQIVESFSVADVEQLTQAIEKTQKCIEDHKNTFLGNIRHREKIRELEQALGLLSQKQNDSVAVSQKRKEQYEKDMREYARIIEDVQKEIRTDIERDELMRWKDEQIALRRISKQTEYLEARENEERLRSVACIIHEKGTYFVHVIGDPFKGSTKVEGSMNSNVSMSLETQLEVLPGLEPTISCSTFQVDEKDKGNKVLNIGGFWLGVVLCDGRVEEALPGDARTKASNLYTRKARLLLSKKRPDGTFDASTEESIDVALTRQREHVYERTGRAFDRADAGYSTYNEFVVSRPKVAGIFLNYDMLMLNADFKTDAYKEKIKTKVDEFTEKYHLPVFVLEHDVVHYAKDLGEFNADWSRSVPTPVPDRKNEYYFPREQKGFEVLYENISKQPPFDRREYIEKIFEDSPFGYAAESVAHIAPSVYQRDAVQNGELLYQYINSTDTQFSTKLSAWFYNKIDIRILEAWQKQKPNPSQVTSVVLEEIDKKGKILQKDVDFQPENSLVPFLLGFVENMSVQEKQEIMTKLHAVYQKEIPNYKKMIAQRFNEKGGIKILPEDYEKIGFTSDKQREFGIHISAQQNITPTETLKMSEQDEREDVA